MSTHQPPHRSWNRRDFLALTSISGVVFASGLGCAAAPAARSTPALPAKPLPRDFFFLQLSDTHWGFEGPANPEAATCLKRSIAAINSAAAQPDFIVFTGDLTNKTDDAAVRHTRMREFRELASGLRVQKLIFLPGEHDAAADSGAAYREHFGALYQAFEHQGVYFIALDNASAPGGALGDAQLAWLGQQLANVPETAPLVVLAHRPLFDLYPEWEWATSDGARAIELLSKHANVSVFYGHIHQEHHHTTGNVVHHSARSLIFPLPAPGAVPKRAPLAWDPTSHDHGLGYRSVTPGINPRFTEIAFDDAGVSAQTALPSTTQNP